MLTSVDFTQAADMLRKQANGSPNKVAQCQYAVAVEVNDETLYRPECIVGKMLHDDFRISAMALCDTTPDGSDIVGTASEAIRLATPTVEWDEDALLLATVVQRLQDGSDAQRVDAEGLPWSEAFALGHAATLGYLAAGSYRDSDSLVTIASTISRSVFRAVKPE